MTTQAITTHKAVDALARLLSTENITIIRGSLKTASFDIKNRVLRLPIWNDMTEEIEQMLILHEIGHALFTVEEEYSEVFEKGTMFVHYANIIEDARIEKKVKERYPGSRKTFIKGYEHLMQKDFFCLGFDSDKINTLNFIDRINLHFKLGFKAKVSFTNEEYEYVRRVDQCDTIKDVIKLSEELIEYVKQSKRKTLQQMNDAEDKNMSFVSDEDEEYDAFNEDDDEYEDVFVEDNKELNDQDNEEVTDKDNEEDNTAHSENEEQEEQSLESSNQTITEESLYEEDLRSSTYDAMHAKLEMSADENLRVSYFQPKFAYEFPLRKMFTSYKQILDDMKEMGGVVELDRASEQYSSFKRFSSKTVSYLIKEFEMKKSADSYKRQRISKTGELDSRKLFSYKIKDDIFKNVTKIHDSQKHGMIFLLDWSGSMETCMKETVEQVINLSMFCHNAGIRYRVFAFSSVYSSVANPQSDPMITRDNGIGTNVELDILELLSDKMTKTEFNKMCNYLYSKPWHHVNKLRLGSTPLNDCLVVMTDYIGKFIEENQTQKNSFIVLTDGQSDKLSYPINNAVITGRCWNRDTQKYENKLSYLLDPITKKQYPINDQNENQTACLLKLIKDRYQIKNIRFFISYPSTEKITKFVRNNFNLDNRSYAQAKELAYHISKAMRKEDYYCISNRSDVDEMYIISSKIKTTSNNDFHADSSMNARQLSKNMSTALNTSRASRIILSKFMTQVA